MNAKRVTDLSALSLILYPFQFERVTDDFSWDERHQNRLSNLYELNRLRLISEHIDHYFLAKDIDLSDVLPCMNASVAQKEILLEHICKGIKQIINTVGD